MIKFDKVKLNQEEEQAIKAIIDDFENEDKSVRERQIRTWKKLEFYWTGFQQIWWDSVAHDWRIYGMGSGDGDNSDNQAGYYDKTINVFRAYLETIIAALSTTVPPVKCVPDDADNVNDVLTAKGGTKIAELIYLHNDAPLLWVRALWTCFLQGMIAAYSYTDEDSEYGEVEQPDYREEEEITEEKICPNCGGPLNEPIASQLNELEQDEFDPGNDDIILHGMQDKGTLLCPMCQVEVDPEIKQNKVIVTRLVGTIKQPKARQCIEVNGGLYVRVPNWARTQKDCPYLSYSYETHYANIYSMYPDLRETMIDVNTTISSSDGNQLYERWGRLSPQYRGEYPLNTPTVRKWWLRPCAFNTIKDDDLMRKFRKKFPDGCHVIMVNDQFVQACNESLDDHWTLMFNPLSNSIHFDPLATMLTSIQEITSELVSLELQTIEHGIPQTFASPKRLNFEQYRNTEVLPGAIYPTLPGSRPISEDFFTIQTATVSPELAPFGAKINEMGQFVSGALPSLFGGAQSSSSRTASQYAMSRNQALQRLQITWKTINYWWKNIFGKVIPAYIKDMLEDEHLVKNNGDDNFINVVIHKAQLDGKIGSIELEATEGLPITVDQIKDTIMELIKTGNEQIIATIGSPENLPILAEALGINDFVLPGEDDRQKQFEEITLLLGSAPIPGGMNPMTGQPIEMPSVMPELDVDNHKIEAEICRNWLVGERGRQAKTDNPEGYRNILLHLQVHMQMLSQLMAPPPGMMAPPSGNSAGNSNSQGPGAGPKPVSKLRPVPSGPQGPQGAENVG